MQSPLGLPIILKTTQQALELLVPLKSLLQRGTKNSLLHNIRSETGDKIRTEVCDDVMEEKIK